MEKFFSLPVEKQNAIIDAALKSFGANGYKKSSVSDIAAAARISKAMIFHYFGTKSKLRYKISGKNTGYASIKEEGKEDIGNVAIARTIHFDKFINKSKDKVEQFVVMGAGYDARCYGELNNLTCFELDQSRHSS